MLKQHLVLHAGWLDSMLEQFEESRQHNVLHSVLRADDRWDSMLSASRHASAELSATDTHA